MPRKDTFKTWKENGTWPENRKRIIECVKNQCTDKEIASCLRISQDTFIQLKKNHPEIIEAIEEGKREDKEELINAMRLLALGKAKTISERKVMKTKKCGVTEEKTIGLVETTLAPNAAAIEYLLATGQDDRFSLPARKLKFMENQLKKELEDIENARCIGKDSDEENN